MTLSTKDGGLPPDSIVQDDDEVLADSERLVKAHHDPSWGSMVRVALAPCSPFSVSPELMRRTAELRAAGAPVGLGCDGSASTDSASLWIEARTALLLGRQRHGPTGMTAREVLEVATRGGAGCLGRTGEIGELTVGAVGDLVCWPQEGVQYVGTLTDPVEAWLRCGPVSARHTVVAGKVVVRDGALTVGGVGEKLKQHAAAAARIQVVEP